MRRGRLGVHDDFCSDEFLKVVAGAAVIRMGVGVDCDGFESKPFIGEKREVTVNLFANRIDQNGHMILFAPDLVGFAFAPVEFTKQHYDLLIRLRCSALSDVLNGLNLLNALNLSLFIHPQTLRAVVDTSSSLRCMSSQDRRFPEAAEAKPH